MLRNLLGLVLIAGLVAVFTVPVAASAAPMQICENKATGVLTARGKCGAAFNRILLRSELQGSNGTDGANFYDVLPSGVTITGVIGGDWRVYHSFPAPIGRTMTSADVIVANTSVVNNDCGASQSCLSGTEAAAAAECTGTAAEPTAPAGKVCIYPVSQNNIEAASIDGLIRDATGETTTKGFVLDWTVTNAASDTYLTAIWAYTQP